jgi:hypothetical protein
MPLNEPSFEDLLAATEHTAFHLETRDVYAVDYERVDFETWQRSGRWDNPAYWQPWIDTVAAAVRRGVVMRRAHVVSLPLSESARFEHAGTVNNLAAGEDVRWLPRPLTVDVGLPGTDFWVFDGRVVRFGHFTGDGAWVGQEIRDEPKIAALCVRAFDQVWERATPHADFPV